MIDLSNEIYALESNRDENRLLVQNSGDGGDSLQRNSHEAILRGLARAYNGNPSLFFNQAVMNQFEVGFGLYVRHPDKSKWYSNPNNCSRDQIGIAAQSMVVTQDTARLWRLTLRILSRFGFMQNYYMGTDVPTREEVNKTVSLRWPKFIRSHIVTLKTKIAPYRIPDIITPGMIATIIRGLNLWILYPALLFLDIFMLGDLYFRKKNVWDIDNMTASQIMIANYKYPTPVARLVKRMYAQTDYKERIANYYKDGIPPLGDMYVKVAKEIIG
jgi:hypothetical protein